MKMISKRFSSSSAGMLLEKVITKNYEMFQRETSMRKPFFSKATCSSTKKEFLHILFPWKFRKMSRKKHKNDEYFYRYVIKLIKLTGRSLSKQSFSKCSEQMYNVESFGRYFSFCPRLIRRSHSCLISFRLFDGIWWKLKDGFFPERLSHTAYCSTAWHNENNYERSCWITGKVKFNLSLLFF